MLPITKQLTVTVAKQAAHHSSPDRLFVATRALELVDLLATSAAAAVDVGNSRVFDLLLCLDTHQV